MLKRIAIYRYLPEEACVQITNADHRPPFHQDFMPKLKQHLLPRVLLTQNLQPDPVGQDPWVRVVLQHNCLFSHKLLRVNYTTYDIRRAQDVIHVGTSQCNVILLNSAYCAETWGSVHPYLYAKVLGVFHANVGFLPTSSRAAGRVAFKRIDVLWVHWFQFLGCHNEFSLDRLSLCPLGSNDALGFVDPADVLRGVHLIPQFPSQKSMLPIPSFRFSPKGPDLWNAYYINRSDYILRGVTLDIC